MSALLMRETMANHAVYFYEDDAFLIDHVAHFVTTGLEKGETAIVVATEAHRSDLKTRLMANGIIGLASPADARYLTLDAASTLPLFMLNDWPEERLFFKVMDQIISSSAHEGPVRIYGEMVAVLWAQGKHKAAIRLEQLWNELAKQRDFSLLCSSPASDFERSSASALEAVCACHTQVTGRRPTRAA